MRQGFLKQGWLVIVLALAFGAALAGVEIGLKGTIKANQVKETLDQAPRLVPGADKAKTRKYVTLDEDEKVAYKVFAENGSHIGWVIPASGSGFADKITLLIGLDAEAKTLTGLYVLDQKETPNLGSKIKRESFRSQFAGKSTLVAMGTGKVGDAKVNAISGATISSDSVCDIVNKAVREFRRRMGELKEPVTAKD